MLTLQTRAASFYALPYSMLVANPVLSSWRSDPDFEVDGEEVALSDRLAVSDGVRQTPVFVCLLRWQ